MITYRNAVRRLLVGARSRTQQVHFGKRAMASSTLSDKFKVKKIFKIIILSMLLFYGSLRRGWKALIKMFGMKISCVQIINVLCRVEFVALTNKYKAVNLGQVRFYCITIKLIIPVA